MCRVISQGSKNIYVYVADGSKTHMQHQAVSPVVRAAMRSCALRWDGRPMSHTKSCQMQQYAPSASFVFPLTPPLWNARTHQPPPCKVHAKWLCPLARLSKSGTDFSEWPRSYFESVCVCVCGRGGGGGDWIMTQSGGEGGWKHLFLSKSAGPVSTSLWAGSLIRAKTLETFDKYC